MKVPLARRLTVAVAAALMLSACGGAATPAPPAAKTAGAAGPASSGGVGGASATASPAGAASAGAAGGSQALTPVSIGITSISGGYMPLYVGMQAGTWAKFGLKPLITHGAPPVIVPGLTKGDLEFLAALPPALEAREKGLPIRALMVYQDHPEYLLVGAPGVTQVSQLRGATLAGAAPGELPSEMLQAMLQIEGLSPGSYKTVPLNNDPARAAMIASGKAKAGMLGVAEALPLLARGDTLLASSLQLIHFPSTGLATTLGVIKKDPALVRRTIAAVLAMVQLTIHQPALDEQTLEHYYHLSPAFAKQMTQMEAPGFNVSGRPSAAAVAFQTKLDAASLKLARPLTESQEFDFSFLPASSGGSSS